MRSEMTRTQIVKAALEICARGGFAALTVQAVADRTGLSKSGVFSRIGSLEALQMAVVREFGLRLNNVFAPDTGQLRGLVRLQLVARRWISWLTTDPAALGYLFAATAVDSGETSNAVLHTIQEEVARIRQLFRKAVIEAVEDGELTPEADVDQLTWEISSLGLGALHGRFLNDEKAGDRARSALLRLIVGHSARPTACAL